VELGLRLMVAAAMLSGSACDRPPTTPGPSAQPESLTLKLETADL
jgi:hypothetical protein